jgi:plastocyanin
MSHTIRSISIASILTLAACGGGTGPYGGGSGGGGGSPPPPPPRGNEISATPSLTFNPRQVTINPGEEVVFEFGSVAHNVTFDAPDAETPADIPGNNSNKSVDRTFTTSGTYRFHCTIHPGMTGSIVVR